MVFTDPQELKFAEALQPIENINRVTLLTLKYAELDTDNFCSLRVGFETCPRSLLRGRTSRILSSRPFNRILLHYYSRSRIDRRPRLTLYDIGTCHKSK